jgi:DNA polymerase III sliding clamp (beta) subunit (PCNA family)
MNRKKLIDILKRVQPAIASKEMLPILSCFCFYDDFVEAYDDVVGIRVPCDPIFVGGVKGKLLLEFLLASRAKELSFQVPENSESEITIKAGRSKLLLPFFTQDEFAFTFPEVGDAQKIKVTPDILSAIKAASVSLGVDPSHPWRLGVTAVFDKKGTTFYSSDSYTISVTKAKTKAKKRVECIFPPRFVQLFNSISKDDAPVAFYVSSEWVMVEFESGLWLFSRTTEEMHIQVNEFKEMVESASPEEPSDVVTIPKGFSHALDRALVLLSQEKDKVADFEVRGAKLFIECSTSLGRLKDSLKLEGHGHTSAKVGVVALKKALDFAEVILFSDSCVYMRGEGFEHFIAVQS